MSLKTDSCCWISILSVVCVAGLDVPLRPRNWSINGMSGQREKLFGQTNTTVRCHATGHVSLYVTRSTNGIHHRHGYRNMWTSIMARMDSYDQTKFTRSKSTSTVMPKKTS